MANLTMGSPFKLKVISRIWSYSSQDINIPVITVGGLTDFDAIEAMSPNVQA
ncbi:hypothetical protein O9992_30355 [Vibrio lentus]|nr:hypothetical protein [Vibrio lentus]